MLMCVECPFLTILAAMLWKGSVSEWVLLSNKMSNFEAIQWRVQVTLNDIMMMSTLY